MRAEDRWEMSGPLGQPRKFAHTFTAPHRAGKAFTSEVKDSRGDLVAKVWGDSVGQTEARANAVARALEEL